MATPDASSPPPDRLTGLFAALVTPTHDDGRVDLETFDRLVDFAVAAGAAGICIAGATGEYPHFETAEREVAIPRAAERLPADRALLVGIGAPTMALTVAIGQVAREAGARALLLPMPMFFRYEQADLAAFCAHVSGAVRTPCLLYNLPAFTNGLAPDTMVALLQHEPFVVGVKDSSGELDNLETLARQRGDQPWTLLVGDDRLLRPGLQAGWDGGISGVAGFCPELLVALYASVVAGEAEEAGRLQALLDELIARIAPFPTPWGIRIGLAARGIATGPFPLPLTAVRRQQIAAFSAWLPGWLEQTGLRLAPTGR